MATRTYGAGTYGWGYYGLSMSFNLLSQSARNLYHDLWRDPHLVGFWPMNDGSSTPLYDHALSQRNNATAVGAVAGGSVGNLPAFTFTGGSSHRVDVASSPINFGKSAAFTLLVAAKHNAVNANHTYLAKLATQGLVWQQDASGKPYAQIAQDINTSSITKESNVANVSATPYLLGLTYDGGGAATGMTFWRNGSTESSSTVQDNLSGNATTPAALQFGTVLAGGYMDGALGFVAMFNAVKSPIDMKRWARIGGFA